MINYENHKLYFDNFPFWNTLTASDQGLLCQNTTISHYSKGMNVHGGSGDCTGTIIIKQGCLRVYMLSDQGKEITLYRLYPGEVCILSSACVLSTITFEVFIDAEENSELLIISGSVFAEVAQRNIHVENFALRMATDRFSDVVWVMQQILFMSFDQRLAVFLHDEMSKSGSTMINLTHEQIAKYMSSAREVVSRMLKYFVSEGIVELSRGGVKVVDKEKLRNFME